MLHLGSEVFLYCAVPVVLKGSVCFVVSCREYVLQNAVVLYAVYLHCHKNMQVIDVGVLRAIVEGLSLI